HGLRRTRAVGHPRGIAEIKEILVRQRFAQRAQDGETADAGVEDADGEIDPVPDTFGRGPVSHRSGRISWFARGETRDVRRRLRYVTRRLTSRVSRLTIYAFTPSSFAMHC